MSVVNNYIPEEGIMVYSNVGCQRITSVYNNGFNYRSRIGTDIIPINKYCVDSCWETGNIYYVDGCKVYKKKYNGDYISSLDVCNVSSIAISQAYLPMAENPQIFREDNGCWIVDNFRKEFIKTDNQLNIVSTITNLSDPVLTASSDFDGGCYLFDDGLHWIMKINSNAEVVSYINYSAFYGALTSATTIKRAIVDHLGNLWFLNERYIYEIILSNGLLYRGVTLDPLTYLGLDSYSSPVSDFDIDRDSSSADLYVVGGCRNTAWLINYNLNGNVINYINEIGIEHPVAIKVTQYHGSNGIYIITESDERYLPDECVTSSSSSSEISSWSSESIGNTSSSSSSRSSTSSSSSSIDSSSSSSSANSCNINISISYVGHSDPYERQYNVSNCPIFYIYTSFYNFNKPDRLIVLIDGVTVYDTGCFSSDGYTFRGKYYSPQGTLESKITIPSESHIVTIRVVPNCAGTTGTEWILNVRSSWE